MRTKQLIERLDSRWGRIETLMARLDQHMERGNEHMERGNDELRLSRESRERMVADFRQLAADMETRFERVVRSLETHMTRNTEVMESLVGVIKAQTDGLLDLFGRPPPSEGGLDTGT